MVTGASRLAPSPSGDLHVGNLRTYTVAWLDAKLSGRRLLLRVEDVDSQRSVQKFALRQAEDLWRLGLVWDGPIVSQSNRAPLYEQALAWLEERGLVYECYCSRKDIQEASRAPHAAPGAYPGTCRDLSDEQRREHRQRLAAGGQRVPALRLRADVAQWEVREVFACDGRFVGDVDDFVVRRGDGDWAYNFAVVVDDLLMGVNRVVRGDDLLSSAPRQNYLASVLFPWAVEHSQDVVDPAQWSYVHVPLVMGPAGTYPDGNPRPPARLAKRDGAVSVRQMGDDAAFRWVAESLGYPTAGNAQELLEQVGSGGGVDSVPHEPVYWSPTVE